MLLIEMKEWIYSNSLSLSTQEKTQYNFGCIKATIAASRTEHTHIEWEREGESFMFQVILQVFQCRLVQEEIIFSFELCQLYNDKEKS